MAESDIMGSLTQSCSRIAARKSKPDDLPNTGVTKSLKIAQSGTPSRSRSLAVSATWEKKRQAASPITEAVIAEIKKQFRVTGRVKVLTESPYYAVSDDGRVFSTRATLKDAGKIRQLKPGGKKKSNDSFVIICTDKKRLNRRVDRLVAAAFGTNKN